MRIDIKTVRSKPYLQYVDRNTLIHHLGSVYDFDSWLLAIILWNQDHLQKRTDFHKATAAKIRNYIELDEGKERSLNSLSSYYLPAHRMWEKRIRLPASNFFYEQLSLAARALRLPDDENTSRVYITEEDIVRDKRNEEERTWRAYMQKRLDEISNKQRHALRARKSKRAPQETQIIPLSYPEQGEEGSS